MTATPSYFFCGIGGSGMMPLALIVKAQGADVEGSDRALDQGRIGPKFQFLREQGIGLFPQDGSGITRPDQVLVASAAVEDTVPDVIAANRVGAGRLSRAELLARLFNAAPRSVGVAGTSGKSTTTAMIAWILHATGHRPTVMNGADMKNFVTEDAPFASALVGAGEVFVSEVDESDGSIALYNPTVAVVNNMSLDHKSMDELRRLFGGFVGRAETAILNLDNDETASLADQARGEGGDVITFGLEREDADFAAAEIAPAADGVGFVVRTGDGSAATVRLRTPGRHNVANALAALAAVSACGVPLGEAADALQGFQGVRRRLEVVGQKHDILVIDDFAHNPDKIAATLETLHAFPGRLLVMFQPHGYGPLRLMRQAFIDGFVRDLGSEDVLLMPEPVYFGGTVDRSVSSADIASGVSAGGRRAEALADRAACGDRLLSLARPRDRIVVMGARDDTLTVFANEILARL